MIKEETGGIPVGYKLSAQHIEKDIDAALSVGCDYIILDGRGGGTGAAPLIFQGTIFPFPPLPALARARKTPGQKRINRFTLVITGGTAGAPRTSPKHWRWEQMLSLCQIPAIQAIGCLGMRACHTNNCPVGVATQKDELRKRLIVDESAKRLANFFHGIGPFDGSFSQGHAGHSHLNQFNSGDLTTFNRDMAYLTGIQYGGVVPLQ